MFENVEIRLRRRQLLKIAATVPLVEPATAAFAQSGVRGRQGTKTTLKVGSSQPTHTDNAHTIFFDAFLTDLLSRTHGEVGAIFYGDSQLGPEDKYPVQINSGTLDIMMVPSDWTTIVPELGVLTMGFLFDSLAQTGKAMDGSAGQQLQAIFKKKTRAEILGWCYNFGGRNVLCKQPIPDLAAFHGKKLRVLPSPTFVQTFRLLGADPVPMSFNEIYISLQTGVIDGLEHDPLTMLQFKFYETAKNLMITQHIFDPCAPVVSDATMQRLGAPDREAVRRAAAAGVAAQRPKAEAAAQVALTSLQQKGVHVVPIERKPLIAKVKPLWTSFTGQHPDTKPVLAAILAVTGQSV